MDEYLYQIDEHIHELAKLRPAHPQVLNAIRESQRALMKFRAGRYGDKEYLKQVRMPGRVLTFWHKNVLLLGS